MNWEHPKQLAHGSHDFKPLHDGRHADDVKAFEDCPDDYFNRRPELSNYMPKWPEDVAVGYQIYENTTEGTPISPVMASPEELARWLVDNKASTFADQTGTYEGWLQVAKGDWAPSMVITDGVMQSGVEALKRKDED